jgi:antitoxin HicB
MRYSIVLTPDDNDTFLVTVPDVPEAVTFGEDREDALARAAGAIETALMGRIADRDSIPEPRADGSDYVDLPALSVAKIGLYRATRAEGVGKAALAKRLGVALPQIDRLLDLRLSPGRPGARLGGASLLLDHKRREGGLMSGNRREIGADDYAEIPELTDAWFDRATPHTGGMPVRRGTATPAP